MEINRIQDKINEKALDALETKAKELVRPLNASGIRSEIIILSIKNASISADPTTATHNEQYKKSEVRLSIGEVINAIESKYVALNKSKALKEASEKFIAEVEALRTQLDSVLDGLEH